MTKLPSDKESLNLEAKAFDEQIIERVKAGHIPDLRRVEECKYFYNNSWRHPEYVKLDFGDQFNMIVDAINAYLPRSERKCRILEVGCGPGYLSLELSRLGHDVIGVDLSFQCVQVAKKCADDDPWKSERGSLEYFVEDFLNPSKIQKEHFDVIYFVGALHHFADQDAVCRQCKALLVDNGIIIAIEPTRDRMTRGNAVIVHLIETLLSVSDGYYNNRQISGTIEEMEKESEKIFNNLRYENETGEKVQSVNDNDAGYSEMIKGLDSSFIRLKFEELYGFFHELIGGLRFEQTKNNQLARYLRDVDRELCRQGVIEATEFLYVGKIK